MYEGHSVGVIVPAYNEIDSIGTVLDTIPAFVDDIFVVDDASTDGTLDLVQSRARAAETAPVPDGGNAIATDRGGGNGGLRTAGTATAERWEADSDDSPNADGDERIVPISHEENRGAGGALKTGYHHAQAAGSDLVVTLDADGQMDPAIMDRFLDPLVARERAFAKGDRLASAELREGMPRFRLLGNWLLTHLTRVASGYWNLEDPQNGYTAITGEALAAIDVDALPDHHDYCNALFAQLQVADVEVLDVPMRAVYGDEESTIEFRSFVPRTSKTLLRSLAWRLRRQYLSGGSQARDGVDENARGQDRGGSVQGSSGDPPASGSEREADAG